MALSTLPVALSPARHLRTIEEAAPRWAEHGDAPAAEPSPR
ncbi:hypothetical protein [Streptosporangium amethystogenes]|nr:hypothetical protein [Streptosporangium amethystogenes]